MSPQQPKIHLTNAPDYREGYANSVQIRVNLWDFFLLFGQVNQTAPDQVSIQNFQGVYVSPQQAKALLNVLQNQALRLSIANNGYMTVVKKFSSEKTGSSYEALFTDLVE